MKQEQMCLITSLVQRQTQALDDRLSKPYAVRVESWIDLT
jgi:hypothetical protein